MFLSCQKDAYLQESTHTLLACQPNPDGTFTAHLDDSVLYPEGGGQPCDWGFISNIPVSNVQKALGGGVHCTVSKALPPGPLPVRVDWERRWDHMQQHSAQHLLTAIAHHELDAPTVGFHLGETYSAIELDVSDFLEHQQHKLIRRANQIILENRPLTLHTMTAEVYQQKSHSIRSRKLPDGHTGDVRLVEIQDLDINTCGGTHVRSTSELQMITLLGVERIRKRVRLLFLAGNRVLRAFQEQNKREKTLAHLLNTPPEHFVSTLQKQQEELQQERSLTQKLQEELCVFWGQQLASQEGPIRVMHKENVDLRVLHQMAKNSREIHSDGLLILTSSPAEEGEGIFLILGQPEETKAAGRIFTEQLQGRGGGKPGTFQGKVSQIQERQRAIQCIQQEREEK